MRRRVDASEGGIGPVRYPPSTTNLIEVPEYDQALKKTFHVNERNVSPVLHDEIVPVVIVEDLRASIHPSVRRVIASGRNLGLAGQQGFAYVRCAPQGPTVFTTDRNQPARLVVEKVEIISIAANVFALIVDRVRPPDNIAGEGTALVKAPHSGVDGSGGFTFANKSGFTATLFDNKVFGGAPNGSQEFQQPAAAWHSIDGPFELPPDWALFIVNTFVGVATFYTIFHCIEYPT